MGLLNELLMIILYIMW